jgi:hypothetical protein
MFRADAFKATRGSNMALGLMNRIFRATLQAALLPILALVLFFAHGWISLEFSELPSLFPTRPLKLSALLAGSVFAAVVVAAVFAYPLAKTYGHFAALAAIAICLPVVVIRVSFIPGTSRKTFVVLALVLEQIALVVLLPLATWLLARRRPNNALQATRNARA